MEAGKGKTKLHTKAGQNDITVRTQHSQTVAVSQPKPEKQTELPNQREKKKPNTRPYNGSWPQTHQNIQLQK